MYKRKESIRRQMLELNEKKKTVKVFNGANDLCYKRHRKEVLQIKKKIDNFCPTFSSAKFFAQMKFKSAQHQMEFRTRTNLGLVNYLNLVHRTQGKVDCFNHLAAKRNSNVQSRLFEQQHIERVNMKISKDLQSIDPTRISCTKHLRDDWEMFTRPSILNRSKYPIAINALLLTEFDACLKDPPSYDEYKEAQKVFFSFHLASHGEIGTITVMLTCSYEPEIVEKFVELCQSSYRGCKIHKIIKGLLFETCDLQDEKVSCALFPRSRRKGEHLYPGTLSLLLEEDDSVSSKFCITLKKVRSLDGKQIVIGRVVKGLDVLLAVDGFGTCFGKPRKAIFIKNSGTIK